MPLSGAQRPNSSHGGEGKTEETVKTVYEEQTKQQEAEINRKGEGRRGDILLSNQLDLYFSPQKCDETHWDVKCPSD